MVVADLKAEVLLGDAEFFAAQPDRATERDLGVLGGVGHAPTLWVDLSSRHVVGSISMASSFPSFRWSGYALPHPGASQARESPLPLGGRRCDACRDSPGLVLLERFRRSPGFGFQELDSPFSFRLVVDN